MYFDAKNDEGERLLLPSGVVSLDGDKIKSYLNYERSDENEDDLDIDSDDFDPFAESEDDLGLDEELNYGNTTLLDKDDF